MADNVLLKAAFEFKKTKLWKKLDESQVFGICMPDGEYGYISIAGAGHDYFGISVYIGEEGAQSLRRLIHLNEMPAPTPFQVHECMVKSSCYCMFFGEKEACTEEEIRAVRAFVKEEGIHLGGRYAYPRFIKLKPDQKPVHELTPEDRAYLTCALRRSTDLSRLIKGQGPRKFVFMNVRGNTESVPFLYSGEDGCYLKEMIPLPAMRKPVYKNSVRFNEIALRKLKHSSDTSELQCELVMLPVKFLPEDEERYNLKPKNGESFFPFYLMVADENGILIQTSPFENYEDHADDIVNDLLVSLTQESIMPECFYVRDERTYVLLKRLAEKLQVPIEIRSSMKALDYAEDSLMKYINGDVDEMDEEIDDMLAYVNMVLGFDAGELAALPPEELTYLKELALSGILPKDLESALKIKLHL